MLSPLSLRESPRPESLDEFFLSRRLALAFTLTSWMLGAEIQLPLTSLSTGLDPAFSSSPDRKESLKLSTSMGEGVKMNLSLKISQEQTKISQYPLKNDIIHRPAC